MHIELQLLRSRDALLFFQLRHHQLEFVEQARIQRDVLGPDVVLIIVRNEITNLQMLADREIEMLRIDLEEAIRMLLVLSAPELFGEVCPDAIAVEHRTKLLLERAHDGDRRLTDDLAVAAVYERQIIEAGNRRRRDVGALDGVRRESRLHASQRGPLVRE